MESKGVKRRSEGTVASPPARSRVDRPASHLRRNGSTHMSSTSSDRALSVAVVGLEFGAEFVPIYRDHPAVGAVAVADLNDDLLRNPFDEAFKSLTSRRRKGGGDIRIDARVWPAPEPDRLWELLRQLEGEPDPVGPVRVEEDEVGEVAGPRPRRGGPVHEGGGNCQGQDGEGGSHGRSSGVGEASGRA